MDELFETLYDEYSRKVYGHFYLCFSNRETAEDLTQTVFMKVYKYLSRNRFFMPDSWKAWVFHITVNVKNDHLREMRKQIKCEDIEGVQLTDTVHTPERSVDSICVNDALGSLDKTERNIIELKNKGFTSAEIGRYMGVCDSTVRSRTQTAKINFSRALRHEDVDLN